MSFAQIQILGNAGRDPELNYTPDGTAVAKFSVAVSKKVKNEDQTTWYNCTCWRALAEMVASHVKKGQQVFVQGDLNIRQYVTKDGKSGMSLDVTVDKFTFAGGPKKEATPQEPAEVLEEHPF